jgi:O-antigen/teichoic acid export membrane protein
MFLQPKTSLLPIKMFVSNLILALALTVVIEIIVAILLGYRKKWELLTIVLINVITNPILNYILIVNSYFNWLSINIFIVISLEVIVVIVEWLLLKYTFRKDSKKLLILSVAMNATSFLVGLLLFKV